MGHVEGVTTPLNQSQFPETWTQGENGLASTWGGGVCPGFYDLTFPCPPLPRQALSLLFDTYHNEVDAFLLADVSMDPGLVQLPRTPPASPPVLLGSARPRRGLEQLLEICQESTSFHSPGSWANRDCWLSGSWHVCVRGILPRCRSKSGAVS